MKVIDLLHKLDMITDDPIQAQREICAGWLEVNQPWRTFRSDLRCKPGVMVHVTSGRSLLSVFLIGDINEVGGFCDDCGIGEEAMVTDVLDLREVLKLVVEPPPVRERPIVQSNPTHTVASITHDEET